MSESAPKKKPLIFEFDRRPGDSTVRFSDGLYSWSEGVRCQQALGVQQKVSFGNIRYTCRYTIVNNVFTGILDVTSFDGSDRVVSLLIDVVCAAVKKQLAVNAKKLNRCREIQEATDDVPYRPIPTVVLAMCIRVTDITKETISTLFEGPGVNTDMPYITIDLTTPELNQSGIDIIKGLMGAGSLQFEK